MKLLISNSHCKQLYIREDKSSDLDEMVENNTC